MNSIQKSKTIKIKSFEGIDTRNTHTHPEGTSDLVNFRIKEDGSLKKREGFRKLCDMSDTVRDVWTGKLDGRFRCLVAGLGEIFDIDLSSGTKTVVTPMENFYEPANLFYYRGSMYLVDGCELSRVEQGDLVSPFGYVPLIAKNWSDNELGEIYQPRNLLNDKGRFTYVISPEATSVLLLNEHISSVDSLHVNGVALSSDRYTVGTAAPYVNVSGLNAGDRVELCVTFKNSLSGLQKLYTSTRAVVFGGINTSRPLLYGGEDPSAMFSSVYVSENDLSESKKKYPESDALYFPEDCEFTVGDGQYPITAVSRHYDRLLIFTEGGAWCANADVSGKDAHPVMNINSSIGALPDSGAALLGNSPCTIGNGSIYRWTSDTDVLNDCNAYSISEEIDSLLDEDFYRNGRVFADRRRRELIFCCHGVSDRVWIYSEITKKWTTFSGLDAVRFFETEDGIGFYTPNAFYVLDSSLNTDNGSVFTASFTGNVIDLDTDEKKQLSSIETCFDGNSLTCGLKMDGADVNDTEVTFGGNGHTRVKKRVSSKRFGYTVPSLSVKSNKCEQIHELSITAR